MSNAPTRPILRYYGGKWSLAPWVLRHLPHGRRYVEPFGGGGSILLRKPRSRIEVYNDLDGRVVNVFRVLRDPLMASELERLIRLTPWSFSEYELAHHTANDPVEDARRTIVRSFQAHGSAGLRKGAYSGWRSNDSGSNCHAVHAWVTWPDSIALFTQRLQGVVIEQRDALKVIKQHDAADTVIYADPPYVQSSRTSRHGYENDYHDEDHARLAEVLMSAKSAVVLSGYDSELYRELYRTWRCVRLEVPYSPNGKPSPGREECLWLNALAAAKHRRLF